MSKFTFILFVALVMAAAPATIGAPHIIPIPECFPCEDEMSDGGPSMPKPPGLPPCYPNCN